MVITMRKDPRLTGQLIGNIPEHSSNSLRIDIGQPVAVPYLDSILQKVLKLPHQ